MTTARILCGDVLAVLATLPEASVQCVVTSPPYWGLRDYGIPPSVWGGRPDCAHGWGAELRLHKGGPHGDGVMLGGSRSVVEAQAATKEIRAGAFCQLCGAWRGCLGLEPTYRLYVEHMAEVFRAVRRVLRDDGVLWLNLGDSYAGSGKGGNPDAGKQATNRGSQTVGVLYGATAREAAVTNVTRDVDGIRPKNLIGIPWRVAFALQDDGWWLRSDCIWAKPNPMPESVTDRPTKAHEYLFLLAKSERYFYDADSIAEPFVWGGGVGVVNVDTPKNREMGLEPTRPYGFPLDTAGRNKRTVWTIATQPYSGAHFAVMPEALVEPCILAGSREGDTILDPFAGSGTVGVVALKRGRSFLGVELNPKYAAMARERIHDDAPLLNVVESPRAGAVPPTPRASPPGGEEEPRCA